MMSMTLATAGWAVIWIALVLRRWAPGMAPAAEVSYGIAFAFAAVGLFFGLFSLRAKLAWILITLAPIFANFSLLSLKVVVPGLLDLPSAEAAEAATEEADPPAGA